MTSSIVKRGTPRVNLYTKRTTANRSKRYMQIVRVGDQQIVGQFSQNLVEAVRHSVRRLANPALYKPGDLVTTPSGEEVEVVRSWEHVNHLGQNEWMYRLRRPNMYTVKNGVRIHRFTNNPFDMPESRLNAAQQPHTIDITPNPFKHIIERQQAEREARRPYQPQVAQHKSAFKPLALPPCTEIAGLLPATI